MPTQVLETLLVLGVTLVFLELRVGLGRFSERVAASKSSWRYRRPLRPRTPDDCPHCRDAATSQPVVVGRSVVPYAQGKGPCGRKKHIDTRGQACPNPNCDYHTITAPTVHALVGYGHHGIHDPIHALRFYCQACHRKFTPRRHTALYRLKTPQTCVAQARSVQAVAEGLSAQAAARVFQLSETTVRSWISRAGQHSQSRHQRLMPALPRTYVQLDERRLKVHGRSAA